MKLLLDQNLSFRLCSALDDLFPGSSQARLLGLDRAGDTELWSHAQDGGYTVVTLDSDFREMSALRGSPPKVVLLRCGNQPTIEIERLLRSNALRLFTLEIAEDVDLLEIG